MGDVYFIDVEASGLGPESWPIEVGLAWIEGDAVVSDSRLIQPHPTWSRSAWSPESAAVHGITWETLEGEGRPVAEVADWLIATARGHVVSDAVAFDERWIGTLFHAAGIDGEPEFVAFNTFVRARLGAPDAVKAFLDDTRAPHRAAGDAARLAQAYLAGMRASRSQG